MSDRIHNILTAVKDMGYKERLGLGDILSSEFVSIVITTYRRPNYLKKALDSIKQHADFPYEIIVHDDGSGPEDTKALMSMSDDISITILNNGLNMGLCEAVNRCTEMASSKFVLFMCDDCFFALPSLKDLAAVLSKPYVGSVSLGQDGSKIPESNLSVCGGTRFALNSRIGRGSTIGYRKDVWKEVGGWDLRSTSGQSDNVFLHKIYTKGYWRAVLPRDPSILIGNFEYGEQSYDPSFPLMNGNDCSLPKLFGMSKEDYVRWNNYRREANQWWVDGERTIENRETAYVGISFDGSRYKDTRGNKKAGLNDIPYWMNYFKDIFSGEEYSTNPREIAWEKSSDHGQSKWRDIISSDFGLGEVLK